MAIANGNRGSGSKSTVSPAWTVATWANTPNPPSVASGDFLLVAVSYAANIAMSNVTHAGNNLTRAGGQWLSSAGITHEFWYTATPTTGVQTIECTLASSYFSPLAITAMCFSGASGIGTISFNDSSATPHSDTFAVTDGSMVFTYATSTTAHTSIEIDGTVVLPANFEPNQFNINKIVSGAWTTTPISGTSVTTETVQFTGSISNSSIEIQASGGGGGGRRIFLIS